MKEKIKKFPRYKDIKGMWLDADWSTEENWAWRDVVKPFNGMYTRLRFEKPKIPRISPEMHMDSLTTKHFLHFALPGL